MSSDPSSARPTLGAAPGDSWQTAQADGLGSVNVPSLGLKEYTRAHSMSSNDCAWFHELLSSDAISTGRIDPEYLVRVDYKETKDASTTTTKVFTIGLSTPLDLKNFLALNNVLAVTLCYKDSSRVDPEIFDLLWTKFKLDVSFMRHHFDYKEFRDESGCPEKILDHLREEDDENEDYWTFGGRWNPIQLPSETRASILHLNVDLECLSVWSKDSIVIALVRSKAVYRAPYSQWHRSQGYERSFFPCNIDLYAATFDMAVTGSELASDLSDFPYIIVHFYTRLLVLRCYEDYNLRHDAQPIEVQGSNRVSSMHHPHIEGMHRRRLELVKVKQNLLGYLGPLALKYKSVATHKGSKSTENSYWAKLQGLVTDVEMLLPLYDANMRIYEWYLQEIDSDYKGELASEQLEEAKESKATAISLGKLSNMAFLYLPINLVCAMLGMNLSIYGQGEVPVWVFLVLVIPFSLLTYLPIFLPNIDQRKVRLWRLTYHLAWRSVPAAFWLLMFIMTHNYGQNFEIMNSGLAQVLLGYTGAKTKGWTEERNDTFFKKATWGSQAFWKAKVKKIFSAVEELNPTNETIV